MSVVRFGDRSWDLVSLGASWRERVGNELFSLLPITWDPAYSPDARHGLDQLLSRINTALTDGGRRSFAECTGEARVELMHLDCDQVVGRGDRRYSSERLALALRRPENDLVPILCSRLKSGHQFRVLDGHHRLRAYELAKRPVLAFVVTFTPRQSTSTLAVQGMEVREP